MNLNVVHVFHVCTSSKDNEDCKNIAFSFTSAIKKDNPLDYCTLANDSAEGMKMKSFSQKKRRKIVDDFVRILENPTRLAFNLPNVNSIKSNDLNEDVDPFSTPSVFRSFHPHPQLPPFYRQ